MQDIFLFPLFSIFSCFSLFLGGQNMHIATFSYCAFAYQVPFNDVNSAHHQN